MALDPAILDVTELAYQAAVEPDLWPQVVRRTADLFGARRSIVLAPGDDGALGARGVMASGLPAEALDLYFDHYRRINPIQASIDRRLKLGDVGPLVGSDQNWVEKAKLVHSEFYADFGRRFGIHGSLLITMHGGPTINVLRSADEGDFDTAEMETGFAVQRPLSRAFALGRRLAAEPREPEGLAALLGQAAGALVAADARGRIVYASPAAEALLRAGDGLAVRDGALAASRPAATRALLAAVGRAAERGSGGGLSLERPSGRRAFAVLVTPAGDRGAGERLALISITDPEPQAPPPERLVELFGLTLGEARVAAQLAAGYDAKDIAERLGLSFHTVRAQLARALGKTETRRQAELVALIIRALGH